MRLKNHCPMYDISIQQGTLSALLVDLYHHCSHHHEYINACKILTPLNLTFIK